MPSASTTVSEETACLDCAVLEHVDHHIQYGGFQWVLSIVEYLAGHPLGEAPNITV